MGGWLPEGLPCKNRFSSLPLPTSRYPELADSLLIPPMIVLLLNRAEEFRRQLDSGAVRNQADLARMFCLTRARVTQLLHLLDLEPSIRAYAKSLPPGTPTNMVTERGLRLLLKFPPSYQLRNEIAPIWWTPNRGSILPGGPSWQSPENIQRNSSAKPFA